MDEEELLEHISTSKDLIQCIKDELKDIYNIQEIMDYLNIIEEELERLENNGAIRYRFE